MSGRPLRFLALVIGAWIAVRVTLLWPEAPLPFRRELASIVGAPAAAAVPVAMGPRVYQPLPPRDFARVALRTPGLAPSQPRYGKPDPDLVLLALASFPGFSEENLSANAPGAIPPGLPVPVLRRAGSRWSGSAWAIVRDGGGLAAGGAPSPLLGGAQAGLRIVYALGEERRAALFGRAATPLGRGRAEFALGVQWRPGRAPVTVYGEARLLGGQVAPAIGGFGGGTAALGDFRLEGYGQAGVIARDGVSGFGDGQVRVVRPLGRADLGLGAWGAAQRGAARLDIGPTLAVGIPARPLNLRLTLDWRQRIAGNARPASGPVLALGADF